MLSLLFENINKCKGKFFVMKIGELNQLTWEVNTLAMQGLKRPGTVPIVFETPKTMPEKGPAISFKFTKQPAPVITELRI